MHRRRRCGVIAKALGDIARAKGMTQVARDTGLSRESLYKALSGERAPTSAPFSRSCARLACACMPPCLSAAWQPSYDAVPEPGAPFPVAPFRLSMTASRLLSVALLLAAFSSSAAAEDCVAAFDSAQSDYRRAQSAQDALEARAAASSTARCARGGWTCWTCASSWPTATRSARAMAAPFRPTRPARWTGKPACWLRRNPTGSRSAARS